MRGWKVKANPAQIQAEHFSRVARGYDASINHGDDEHGEALLFISHYIEQYRINSILDVGCGTGRGVEYFLSRHPNMRVYGIEPVDALLEQAINKGIPSDVLQKGYGQQLPFPDNHFDSVCAFGVMHHVERPEAVINEMMRVAKKAIFISDSNRFGQGGNISRAVKLSAWSVGLWPLLNLITTRGTGYHISEGDGLFYSYSVYDNYSQLAQWADQLIMIPIGDVLPHHLPLANPLLTAGHILLCAIKK